MESEGYSKVLKSNESDTSKSKHDGSQVNLTDATSAKEDPLDEYGGDTSEGKMDIEMEEEKSQNEHQNNIEQKEIKSQTNNKCDTGNENKITMDDTKAEEIIMEAPFNVTNLVATPEATTSQDNTPTSSNDNELSESLSDQSKVKRCISKGQMNGDSGISIEKSGNSSDEDSSKRQKLNENTCDRSKTEGENVVDNTPKFHKLKSKVKKRNYRNKKNSAAETGDNEAGANDTEMGQEINESATARRSENREGGVDINSDGSDGEDAAEDDSNEWTTASEDELEEEAEEDTPACLKKEKPKTNWFVIPELISRELGSNPLFQRKYYGSLRVVEHFELMYRLDEHQGCVNALSFNQKGNLLASGSDDLVVVIWDWATGKKHHSFDSGHRSNMFQAKWLPFDVEYLMATCARDGQVRLLDLRRGISRKIGTHHAPTHKLAVHPDTPHVIISVGEDAKVLSIDIRENKPTKLLVVKDGSSDVQLYSVHSNPLNSNEFCVGGRSQSVRIYDRRKVTTPLYKLCPDHLTGNKHAHVTSAVYNYNGTEILASYNDEDIYLFDTVLPQTGDFAHRYQGHRNNATVKGVNFFGPKSEFVVSGSDCGNIFIWEKNTEAIVNWIPGDEQGVVNCLEPHPHIPILATSGLDYDVKIWVPSYETLPVMTNLENCVKYNAVNRAQDIDNGYYNGYLDIIEANILHTERIRNLLLQNLSSRRGSGDRNRDDDDDDDDDNVGDSSNDDSSDHSDSQSEGEGIGRLQCSPS